VERGRSRHHWHSAAGWPGAVACRLCQPGITSAPGLPGTKRRSFWPDSQWLPCKPMVAASSS
jgi:hypothetical protein